MTGTAIAALDALEILDSRGRPTLRVTATLADGTRAVASVPSGASTGSREAVELRDGDKARYGGLGVLRAAANVREALAPRLHGMDARAQREVDAAMIALDGTPDKARLGANAILGVSMAVARAAAASAGLPLYRTLSDEGHATLPVPMMNVINGGAHADSPLDIQEFMIVPHGAPNFAEALRYGAETFQALKALLHRRGLSTAVGDEGGFAPQLAENEDALALIVQAIEAAGLRPGPDVAIALDPAANSFTKDGTYRLDRTGMGEVTPAALLALYERWVAAYPIVAIEDGFNEDDWPNLGLMTARLGSTIQIVGDDIYVTNERFIRRGIAERTTNAALIKLNQIGTVTETLGAIALCREAGWVTVISHRSGETEDSFIADLAVATGAKRIKAGSLCRGERVVKYNRLLEIELELGAEAKFAGTGTA